MEHQSTQTDNLLTRIKEIGQGTFFCYNESSKKIPVAVLRRLDFENDTTIKFNCSYLPLTEHSWSVFGGEIYCYKKGTPYSFVLHGVAVSNIVERSITFTIKYIESFGDVAGEEENHSMLSLLVKPYRYFFQKGAAFIGSFKKKDGAMPVNNAAA
ncbi:MAG TPA: hypothetical protein VHB48_09035 [Chitinophagaceae bacterium]|nr:hypothetical protein [Chitinophagaceae bacterium]